LGSNPLAGIPTILNPQQYEERGSDSSSKLKSKSSLLVKKTGSIVGSNLGPTSNPQQYGEKAVTAAAKLKSKSSLLVKTGSMVTDINPLGYQQSSTV
jgi:hypothetical protein